MMSDIVATPGPFTPKRARVRAREPRAMSRAIWRRRDGGMSTLALCKMPKREPRAMYSVTMMRGFSSVAPMKFTMYWVPPHPNPAEQAKPTPKAGTQLVMTIQDDAPNVGGTRACRGTRADWVSEGL